jgi:hypothetical protein
LFPPSENLFAVVSPWQANEADQHRFVPSGVASNSILPNPSSSNSQGIISPPLQQPLSSPTSINPSAAPYALSDDTQTQ